MKLLNKKGNATTIRTVANDDRTAVLGVLGTMDDMANAGIIEITEKGNMNVWVFVRYGGDYVIEAPSKDELAQLVKIHVENGGGE